VVLLGSKSVGSLAASGTASLVFGTDDAAAPPGFWAHAVTTAVAGAVLARKVGGPVDELFSLGLLHDIGSLLLYQRHADRFVELAAAEGVGRQRGRILELEQAAFGIDHARLGADLLDRWNLPERMVNAVRLHHTPAPEVLPDTTSRLLAAAHTLAGHLDDAVGRDKDLELSEALALIELAEKPSAVLAEIERELHTAASFLKEAR
jgi:putative nucleotidyltransferase with HDIG domain